MSNRPLRVFINNQATLGQKSGIGHYATELISALGQTSELSLSAEYPRAIDRRTWPKPVRATEESGILFFGRRVKHQLKKVLAIARRAAYGSSTHRYLSTRNFDLYHEPNFICLPINLPTVVTMHDLSPLLYPQWHPSDRNEFFQKNFPPTLSRISHFITISETIRQEMITKLGLPPERVGVTYMGVREHLRPVSEAEAAPVLARLGLQKGYFLHVGTVEPRKNLLTLMQAYVSLPESVRKQAKLVLVGGWGWNTQEVQDYFTNVAQSAGVIHLGYANEADLPALYCGASALVYPSYYEGFGMPAAEMLACGGVVLASDAQAIQEVIAGCGTKIPAQDVTAWREAMQRAVDDSAWLESLRTGGPERAKLFTWQNCAKPFPSINR